MSAYLLPNPHGRLYAVDLGYGTVILPSCGAHSARNPADQECYCEPGFDSPTGANCKPVDLNAPCDWTGQQRSPIDQKCTCPPGYAIDPSPTGTGCIPMRWFPNCKDALGRAVPGCLFGYPLREVAVAGGLGLLTGLLIGKLLF